MRATLGAAEVNVSRRMVMQADDEGRNLV